MTAAMGAIRGQASRLTSHMYPQYYINIHFVLASVQCRR